MNTEQHPYLRFTCDARTYHGDAYEPYHAVTAPGSPQVYRLSREEFALAELFDGQRDPDARRAGAAALLGREPDTHALHLLLQDLAEAGLLAPGREEPLPPPAQLASALDDRGNAGEQAQGFPSSIQTGSLAGPGGQGPLVGAVSGRRGSNIGPWFRLPVAWLLWIGHLFNVTLYLRLSFLPAGLSVAGLYGLWINRNAVGLDALALLWLPMLALTVLVSALSVNLVSQLARAAAISRHTGEKPVFGLGFAFGFVPRLLTATEGPAERAGPRGRLAIVGAPLNATLWLFVLATIGWFTSRHSAGALSSLWLGGAVISLASFLVRLNPLVRRDGYFLLAHILRAPDLRDQAWLTLFGFDRPWRDRAPPRKGPLQLYALAVAAYVILVITLIVLFPGHWLENFWGGSGVLVFLALIALIVWEQTKRIRAGRGRIESYRFALPQFPRWVWLACVLLALLALFPYPYSPSGPFEILPVQRADVRATASGAIQRVEVHEGEIVDPGEEILRVADAQETSGLRSAQAELKKLQANLALAEAGARNEEIELARQRVATADKRLEFSSAEAERLRKAYHQNAVSIQSYQKAEGNASVQREQLAEARKKLDLVQAKPRGKRMAAMRAEIDAQKAKVAYARAELDKTRFSAPIGGQVVSRKLMFAKGDYLHAGDLVATVQDAGQLNAEIRMPEATIDEVHLGAEATAKFWAYPGTDFEGHVIDIAPQAQTGEYGKIVRVLVAIDDAGPQVRPGMTGHAKIRGGVYPAIVVYTRALVRFVMVEVWSWLP